MALAKIFDVAQPAEGGEFTKDFCVGQTWRFFTGDEAFSKIGGKLQGPHSSHKTNLTISYHGFWGHIQKMVDFRFGSCTVEDRRCGRHLWTVPILGCQSTNLELHPKNVNPGCITPGFLGTPQKE